MTQGSVTIGSIETIGVSATTQLMQDFDYGTPVAETESVARLLYDGEVVTGDRSGNRRIQLPLRIVGTTSLARAALVAQLQTATDGPFQITWTPGDGLPVVFDCFRATLTLEYNSILALQGMQYLTLTCEAAPFTRTPDLVTLTPSASANVTLDTYDSVVGFTAVGAGTGAITTTLVTSPKTQGTGAAKMAFTLPAGSSPGNYSITGSKTIGSTNISAMETVGFYYKSQLGAYHPMQFAELTLSSAGGSKTWRIFPSIGSGFAFLSWTLADTPVSTSGTLSLAAVTGYSWKVVQYRPDTGAVSTYVVADDLAGRPAGSSSNLTSAAGWLVFAGVQGGARTPLSIAIDASSAINNLVLSRTPDPRPGFTPVPTVFSSGGSSVDATAISGARYTAPVYRLPIQSVSGTYVLVVRAMGNATSGTIVATVNTTSDSTYSQVVTANFAGASTTAFALYTIGEVTLPPREADPLNTASTVDIALTGTLVASRFDQLYLIDMAGDSLIVDLPSTLSYRYWWIDAPGPGEIRSRIVAGSASDRSDAVSVAPYVKGPAAFNFEPGSNLLTVVCDKATGTPTVTVSYYPRNLYERSQ